LTNAIFLPVDMNQMVYRETVLLKKNRTLHVSWNGAWRREMFLSSFCLPDTEARIRKLLQYDVMYGKADHPSIAQSVLDQKTMSHIRNVAVYLVMIPYSFFTRILPAWVRPKDKPPKVVTIEFLQRTLDSFKWAVKKMYIVNKPLRTAPVIGGLDPKIQKALHKISTKLGKSSSFEEQQAQEVGAGGTPLSLEEQQAQEVEAGPQSLPQETPSTDEPTLAASPTSLDDMSAPIIFEDAHPDDVAANIDLSSAV